MYVLVRNNEIAQVGNLPRLWVDPDGETHDWRKPPYRTQPEDHGWLSVVREPRPADTATTTWEQQPVAFIDGVPSVGWTERPKTSEELAAEAAQAERKATRLAIRAIVLDIKAEKDRAQAVIDKANANLGPADTKDLARAIKRMADATIDLAKFVRDL